MIEHHPKYGICAELVNRYQSPPTTQIRRLEERLGCSVPRQYCEFLQEFNGGEFADDVDVLTNEIERGIGGIRRFRRVFLDDRFDIKTGYPFGHGLRGEQSDAIHGAVIDCDEPPADVLLVIATAGSGHLVLACDGNNRGAVYFWMLPEHEIFLVNKTFLGFCRNLEIIPLAPERAQETDPLFRAVETGDEEYLSAVIARSGDGEHIGEDGCSLLWASVRYNRPRIVALLLEHGANIHSPGRDGKSPFMVGIEVGAIDCLKALFRHGLNVNEILPSGEPPLMLAMRRCSWPVRVVDTLLEEGADVNLSAPCGGNALGYCFRQDPVSAWCEFFIERGCVVSDAVKYLHGICRHKKEYPDYERNAAAEAIEYLKHRYK